MPTGIGKELRRCRVPSNKASDLAGFSARPLWQNQECKEARHDYTFVFCLLFVLCVWPAFCHAIIKRILIDW